MAKRKKPTPSGEQPVPPAPAADPPKKPKRSGLSLHVYLEPKLRLAIGAAAERNERNLTGEVTLALKRYLREQGLWPPPESSAPEERP